MFFEYKVEAENRALAEVKAKELYKDYKNSNDFFTPSDVSHVKDTFKIVPAVLVDIREALCKECAQKEVSSMTNLDKMRTMSPEELGTFLSNLVTIEDCFECPIRDVCNERMVNPNNEAFHTCELSFYHWLQREYKPGYFENQ